ncbi:UNVERIFIED_CONTAM: hypothetical protein ABIE34_001393 [Jeotgalibacillus campisalis]
MPWRSFGCPAPATAADTAGHSLPGSGKPSKGSCTGSMAMYQNSAVHILFPLGERNLSRLLGCKAVLEALEDGTLSPARMMFYPLPAAGAPASATPIVAGQDPR